MPDGPITLDASEVEEAPTTLDASQVEEAPPKKYAPEVEAAIRTVPSPTRLLDVAAAYPGTQPSRVPRNWTGKPVQVPGIGVPEVAGAMTEMLAPGTITPGRLDVSPAETVKTGVRRLQTPGQRLTGALQTTAGMAEAAGPLAGPMAVESPGTFIRAGAEGYAAGKAGKYGARALGATPEQQEYAENIGQMAPILAHAALRPEVGLETTPEGTRAAGTVLGGRAGAGVAVTPEAVTVRGKVGPLEGTKTFARRPAAKPAIEPPTIEAEAPFSRDEIARAQEATNYAGPEQAEAYARAQRSAAKSAVAVSGEAAVAPKAAGAEAVPAPAPEVPKPVAAQPEVRPARPAPAPKAGPAAAEPITLEAHQVEEAKPQPAETKPAEPETKPAEFQKGDVVQLADGRRGKVEYVAPADKQPVVRVTTDEGGKVSVVGQKAIGELQPGTKYKYGSTQANIPEGSEAHTALEAARQRIAESDLAGKGTDVGGNHVTVRYGIQSDDVEGVKKYLASLAPFEATLGKTASFPPSKNSDGAAVIQAPIESPELEKINAEIEKHGDFAKSDFATYAPHATIAYVDPDKANRYVGMDVTAGKKFPVNEIAITDKQGGQTVVKLEGKPSEGKAAEVRGEVAKAPEAAAVSQKQAKVTGTPASAPPTNGKANVEQKPAVTPVKAEGSVKPVPQAQTGGRPQPGVLDSYTNKDQGMESRVTRGSDGKYNVHLIDLDSGNVVGNRLGYDSLEKASAWAKQLVEQKGKPAPGGLTTGTTIEAAANEPTNQPARTTGEAENLPSVPEPAREGGNAPAPVQAEGEPQAPELGQPPASVGQPERGGVERPARLPGERNEPARSRRGGAAEHPPAEREGGGRGEARPTGADGRAVESPTPEEPRQAQVTAKELRNQRNFHISDEYASQIGTGGEIGKIKGNLDALELFKKIQAEGREAATIEEQETLSKYVDFGGLVGMLQRYWEPQYAKHYERFLKILTQKEIQDIRETLPNTHYTSMEVVDWAWKILQRTGFKGGRWLEPGMGIGNFLGRQPEKISNRSEILGVERNPLTGGMAKLLYPDANISIKPFQHFIIPDNTLDAAIGNVPFQDVAITDDPVYAKLKLNLHNYFIVKTLDKLKPGGIAALITSRYTMDAGKGSSYAARDEMARRADLIAAIRLPDKAFKGNAATEVVADLLIFQKRDPSARVEKLTHWGKLETLKVGDHEYPINEYFTNHPEHVIGTHSDQGSMYRANTYTVKAPEDFSKALQDALETLPKNIYGKVRPGIVPASAQPPPTLDSNELQFAPEDVKPGAFYRDEKGNLRIKQSGVGVKLPEELRSPEKQAHIGRAIDLRDQLNRTIGVQLETSDDGPLKEEQGKLDKLYESYRTKYGSLHGPKLQRVFGEDPEYPKLLALENFDTETKQVSKASIFSKRVLAPYEPLRELPDDPKSAMLKVMAERGYLDTKLMGDLLGKPEKEVIANLEKQDLLYQDPQTGNYHTADEYLSGNVREKLKTAERAAQTDKQYERNVEALKKNQPKPLTIHEIQPNLGQTWVPTSLYQAFVRHLAKDTRGDVEIKRDLTGKWTVSLGGINRFSLNNEWAGGGVPGHKLVQYALNQQQPSVYGRDDKGNPVFNPEATAAARDKLAAIKEEFRTVLRNAPDATVQQLETIYNDTFNGFKLREFDGAHLDFPGMSEDWRSKIRGYQKAAIWRILQEGRGGIFHAPGLGKTLTMAAAGMEARRLKLSRKNMYAVPNHMIPQWREDFKRFYPNANVLAVTDDDFTATNRAKLMSRIATGDWDAIIVPHSQFDLLPMSPDWESKTINKRLGDYRQILEELDEKEDRRTIKQIEKAVDKLESRLNELNAKKKDTAINFDQLGVDMLFVDEAHLYKAMAVPSKMGNIGGLSNRASQRAFALEMKADFLRDTHHGRGLVFGTGTPITNTVGELYVMTKYLAPEMLEAAGIRSFDDWAANFATTITQFEYSPDGVTFKPKTSLSEFVNVPELSTMFRRYAEYISKEQAKQLSNLKEPEVAHHDHMIKITPTQEPLLDWIAQRGDRLTKHPPKTREERQADNWLKLSSDARKVSLDPRLYDPSLNDDKGSKANEAVDVIKKTLDATDKERGTVVVFSDFFQHKNDADKPDFNLFEDMRGKLVKAGVPKSEIAIIHEADSKEEKEALFAKVRSGKVRVIFGSTDKMGIGTNIQNRLKALLHLDQPWRPDQVEQREGRIQRSGNEWEKADVHRFIAEPEQGMKKVWDPDQQKEVEKPRPRAYDLQMYQQLSRKAHFQEQFLTGNYGGRTMEDTGGEVKLNSQMFEIAKAMATGNPDAMRKVKVEHDLRTYGMLERSFQTQRSQQMRDQRNAEFRIPLLQKQLELLKRDEALWAEAKDGDNITLQVGDVTRDKDQIKKWLEGEPDLADLVGKPVKIAGIATDIEQVLRKEMDPRTKQWEDIVEYRYSLAGDRHAVPYDFEKQTTHAKSLLNSFAIRARRLDTEVGATESNIANYQSQVAGFEEQLKKKSPYADKVNALEKELEEIEKRMGLKKSGDQDEGAAPSGEEDEVVAPEKGKPSGASVEDKIMQVLDRSPKDATGTGLVVSLEKLAEAPELQGVSAEEIKKAATNLWNSKKVWPHTAGEGGKDVLKGVQYRKPEKPEGIAKRLLKEEAGTFTPANIAYAPARIKAAYDKLVQDFIDKKLQIGDKYWKVKEYDPTIADTLHLVDNAPRYFREKAKANLDKVTKGLSEDQIRLAHLMVDSDSRDDLKANHPNEYDKATRDPQVMAAVQAFQPLQSELTYDRIALGWPVRQSLHIEEDPTAANPFVVKDRQGNPVADFQKESQAQKYVDQNATIEPHLKRTYPEHMRSPLPAEVGAGPFTGSFYGGKGLRPPKMDKKSREMSAAYHYEHGAKDFSGYLESYAQTKEAVLKQNLFDQLAKNATEWKAGTAQPPKIEYNGETYYRPDIALKAKQGGQTLEQYSIYDPSRGEKFLIRTPDWSTLTTGKPGIGPNDRYLAPKTVVDALENYDASRGGPTGNTLRKFFQEQIVGLFGPVVHINNILRHLGQATGMGAFDPRSWPSIVRVLGSSDLRSRVLKGVDDATIDMLVSRGAYTDWSDIGNTNRYIGGNFNPLTWTRAFGKGVLFNPKFLKGWGGLDPKARVVVADYLRSHDPNLSDQQIADAVNDAFGNYNRANWTERQRLLARFMLFPGWDTASAKWFLRHPFIVGVAGAIVVLAANLALHKLGLNKGDDWADMSYIHLGDRKYRTGLISDAIGEHVTAPVLSATESKLKGESPFIGGTEGLMKGSSALLGQLAGPTVEMIADELYNKKYIGSAQDIVKPEDRYTPGTWAPNRELEKRIAFATLRGLPAVNRFLTPRGDLDWKQGLGAVTGVSNYKYGAEERLKANAAKSENYSKEISMIAEKDPDAAAKYVEDPVKAAYLTFNGYFSELTKDLKEIDKETSQVKMAGDLTQKERKEALKDLEDARNQLLSSADALNEQLSQAKLKKP